MSTTPKRTKHRNCLLRDKKYKQQQTYSPLFWRWCNLFSAVDNLLLWCRVVSGKVLAVWIAWRLGRGFIMSPEWSVNSHWLPCRACDLAVYWSAHTPRCDVNNVPVNRQFYCEAQWKGAVIYFFLNSFFMLFFNASESDLLFSFES